jgi:hypothetical protein
MISFFHKFVIAKFFNYKNLNNMIKNRILVLFAFVFIVAGIQSKAQTDSVEINIIDNFVTPESPHNFVLSFFTSENTKSKVLIDKKFEYVVSDTFNDIHKTRIDISKLNFSNYDIPFVIIVEDSAGNKFTSEEYDFQLPKEIKVKSESNFLLLCLFGGTVFLLPSPVYVFTGNDHYFSLTKEIPLISISKKGFTYPAGYFSLEYSHIFNAPDKNFLRIGYKHIIEVPGIQYISPGVNGFTNFKGFNGISPEVSAGLFKFLDTFIVYIRYRYNVKPGETGSEFHEISLGLYSNFFSLYF